jgi:hypothetical protein
MYNREKKIGFCLNVVSELKMEIELMMELFAASFQVRITPEFGRTISKQV